MLSPQLRCTLSSLEDATMLKIALAAVGFLVAVPAFADDRTSSPVDDSAFALMPATGQHLKIDRRSGTVSLCAERDGTWSCQLLADDRARYEERIADLEKQVAGLKADVDALKAEKEALAARLAPSPTAEPPSPPSAAPSPPSVETDDDRFDRFLGYTDKMFRHFFDLVDELRGDPDKPI